MISSNLDLLWIVFVRQDLHDFLKAFNNNPVLSCYLVKLYSFPAFIIAPLNQIFPLKINRVRA